MTHSSLFILAIDLGTTSTRAILFDTTGNPVARHAIELEQIYPANGWVEHNPQEIWEATIRCCREVAKLVDSKNIVAIGIANQRETTVLWDRKTGAALHNAIVWQDRRTAERCLALKSAGHEPQVTAITGLLLDPYFSATKAEWLLDQIPDARVRAEKNELAFGTLDSFLIFKLTGGQVHATDVTNASRTMLLNLKSLAWDDAMLSLFNIPRNLLPEVRDSAGHFGMTTPDIFGVSIPILGVAGDQQAALFGQACFTVGDVKSTYGTGCFMMVNTGSEISSSQNRLLATSAYCAQGKTAYAIEGSIFIAGAVVQWLRDALGVIATASEIEMLAQSAKAVDDLYFIPAFTGLGAPYWDTDVRAAILGLTRDMGAAEIARAALDAVCFQSRDLLEAIARDMGFDHRFALKVDGGMVKNNWFCQRLADLTGFTVERPKVTETTALGVAYLAGLSLGIYGDMSELSTIWALDRRFIPELSAGVRDQLYGGWQKAVGRVKS